jgi:hypothetical protein
LTECGFYVQIEPVLETTRGTVEVDVYAVEEINNRKYTIACECKKWNSNVSQAVK